MKLFGKNKEKNNEGDLIDKSDKKRSGKFKIILGVVIVLLLVGGFLFWKTGHTLNKITTKGGFLSSIARSLPGVKNELKGEERGRINILLLGMRGEHVTGGGLLADTIMVASIVPSQKTVSLVSIPRDLYVTVPGTNTKQKINAVYFYGEEKEHNGGGIKNMEKIVSEITGQPIDYAIAINFKGFEEAVDAIGGIDIHLDKPFSEPLQFHQEHVCDPNVFTVPSGNFEIKKDKKGRIVAKYPLCYNHDEECGGVFSLPAGDVHLDGEKALCYARSRMTSTDFARARRQQEILKLFKKKLLSAGTLTDFGKINKLLDSLGDNVKTDMQGWEMKKMFDIYKEMGDDITIKQKVLDNSEEGLLYAPQNTTPEQGYILLPRGDNYNRIKELFANIVPAPKKEK